MQYDAATGFALGDPAEIPLSARSGGLPVRADFERELSTMILSASGWRKIFAESGDEEDCTGAIGAANTALSVLIADTFAEYIIGKCGAGCTVAVGIDARPTGTAVADIMLRVLLARGISVQYLFITAAPEIMAYSRCVDGFAYVSASHNPVGHNGVKFGLNDGGVLPGSETAKLTAAFRERCARSDAIRIAADLVASCAPAALEKTYAACAAHKAAAVEAYRAFTCRVVTGEETEDAQRVFFRNVAASVREHPLTVVCDMNGSARTVSIDKTFLSGCGLGFSAINAEPRNIAHAIIPEPENLVHCAAEMARLKKNDPAVTLGYMPDCDGDRGNIVYWNDAAGAAEVLNAQEVFALSVLAELAYLDYRTGGAGKTAVAINDPTSLRIEEIASAFGAKTVRAEVGEANVVNLARELRASGYTVPILGEGSNGGNITHPAAVRDPVNTVFALIKLLVLRDVKAADGSVCKGLFHLWCSRSGQESAYKSDFTLADIIATLPVYTTTGVSEKRALLHIKTQDHGLLKARFQKAFERSWNEKKDVLASRYGFVSYEAVCNNGTKETRNLCDYRLSGKGGLKIIFKDQAGTSRAFMWMRGSGTEPVFRVLCDVKGADAAPERELLAWETELLSLADCE